MTTALVLKATGEVETIEDVTLTALQSAVGGWVQAIDLELQPTTVTMWLNEEGKLTGLPHNTTAQKLWDKAFWVGSDFVVGDVVITGTAGDEGETLPLGDDMAKRIREILVAS